jgi:hypothetical protein
MGAFRFEFRRPQRLAALLLALFALQCLWVVSRQQLTEKDFRYAQCGRELWEKPSPLAGYLTSCGNIQDGIFAYRAAGLPLTLERLIADPACRFSAVSENPKAAGSPKKCEQS